jgi:benzoylformate decarboxylase
MQEVVRVAELIGAQVYGSTFSEVCFPTSHPQYMGLLNVVDPAAARAILDPADVVLAVGMDVFNQSWYAEPLLDARSKLIHMDNALWEVEKNYPIAVGVWCDLKTGLEEFYAALEEVVSGSMQEQAKTRARQMGEKKAQRKQAFLQRAEQVWDGEPIALERVAMELKGMMPKNAIFVDDAVSARGVFLSAMDFDEPSGYIAQRGGSIGWGLPAALGVKLGRLSRPVVAVVGDGSAMCSIQAFWNAAHDNLPVTWVILNNGSYRVLKENMKTYFNLVLGQKDRKSKYIGMDFASPPLDFVSLANGQGVWGIKVTKASELRPALEKALGLGKPAVVDVVVEAGSF